MVLVTRIHWCSQRFQTCENIIELNWCSFLIPSKIGGQIEFPRKRVDWKDIENQRDFIIFSVSTFVSSSVVIHLCARLLRGIPCSADPEIRSNDMISLLHSPRPVQNDVNLMLYYAFSRQPLSKVLTVHWVLNPRSQSQSPQSAVTYLGTYLTTTRNQ